MPLGEIVFDTTCVLYFTITGHDHLLEERYGGRCYLPKEVVEEIRTGEARHGHNCSRLLTGTWWKVVQITELDDQELFSDLLRRWGRADRNLGEAAAIVAAKRLGCTVVVDDLQARNAAKELGVRIAGTEAVLARITAAGRLAIVEGWAIHEGIVARGFRPWVKSEVEFRAVVERLANG